MTVTTTYFKQKPLTSLPLVRGLVLGVEKQCCRFIYHQYITQMLLIIVVDGIAKLKSRYNRPICIPRAAES